MRRARHCLLLVALICLGRPAWALFGSSPDWVSSVAADGIYVRAASGDINGDGYDDLVVGIPYASPNGTVTLYLGGPAGLGASPAWTWTVSSSAYATMGGWSLDLSGDANGDGFKDLAIGALNFGHGQSDEGALFVFYGSASGPASTPDWSYESDLSGDHLGMHVAWADTNGDGYSELYASAENGTPLGFLGGPIGLSASPFWTSPLLAMNVINAGDIDHDGYDDICLGLPYASDGPPNEGRIHVFKGSASGPPAAPTQSLDPNVQGAQYGYSMAAAGDIYGDGYGGILIGSVNWSLPAPGAGAFIQHRGGAGGIASAWSWLVGGAATYDFAGGQVMGLGDVNSDGYGDIATCTIGNPPGSPVVVRVFLGSPSGLATSPVWSYTNNGTGMTFNNGWPNGDYNGDGKADIAFASQVGYQVPITVFYNDSPAPGATASPSPTLSIGPSSSASPTPEALSATATASPSGTATHTPSATATASPIGTAVPSASPTGSGATMTATPSSGGSPTPSPSASQSIAPSGTPTGGPSPTFSATPTSTPSASPSPPIWPTFAPIPSATATPVPAPSQSSFLLIHGLYPVPSDGTVQIYYTLLGDRAVDLSIFNVAGERIIQSTLRGQRGKNIAPWVGKNADGQPCASGIYLIHLQADGIDENSGSAWARAVLSR